MWISRLDQIRSIFSIYLETSSWEYCPKQTQETETMATQIKIKLRELCNRKRRIGLRDRYHERPKKCVADQHTDGDQNIIIIETAF